MKVVSASSLSSIHVREKAITKMSEQSEWNRDLEGTFL